MSSTTRLRPNPLTGAVEYSARRLVEIAEELSRPMEPLGSRRIGPQKQLERYEQMRDDPAAWGRLLQDRGAVETLAYVQEMEKLRVGRDAQGLAEQ